MKKISFILMILIILLCPVSSYATPESAYEFDGKEVEDLVPDSVSEYGLKYDEISDALDFKKVFSLIFSAFVKCFKDNFICVGSVFCILVFMYIIKTLSPTENQDIINILSVVAAVGTMTSIFKNVFGGASGLKTSLEEVASFGTSLMPVLFGAVSASGKAGTAAFGSMGISILFSVLAFVGTELCIPLVNTFFTLGISSSVLSNKGLSSSLQLFKKLFLSIIGVCSFVFSLVMGAQKLLASSADSVTVKTAVYTVRNAVPLVGGSISDSMSAILSSAETVSRGIGVFGCIVIFLLLLTPLLSAAVSLFSVKLLSVVADVFGLEKMSGFFISVTEAYYIILALSAASVTMSIISLGIVMV